MLLQKHFVILHLLVEFADDVLYVEMLNGASAFGIFKNEDGEIISSFVTFGGEEEIKIPKDAVIIEITSNGVSYCGMLY